MHTGSHLNPGEQKNETTIKNENESKKYLQELKKKEVIREKKNQKHSITNKKYDKITAYLRLCNNL